MPEKKDPKITITVEVHDGDPKIAIYRVVIESDNGVWTEAFGSEECLRAFIRGLKAAFAFSDVGFVREPEIPRKPFGL